jgi:hypothetical protein
MPLYTFFLHHEGGTYISQVRAKGHKTALRKWARDFDLTSQSKYKRYFESRFKEKLLESLDIDLFGLLVAIDGVVNTWTFSPIFVNKPTEILFTETVPVKSASAPSHHSSRQAR